MRKHNIPKNHREAFSMVTAIFVIFIMASLTALIMNVTSKTVKLTTQQYQKEQASLLARSYTELAMLYVINYDRVANNNCIEDIDGSFGDTNNLYTIHTHIQYIGNSELLPNCGTNITPSWNVSSPVGFDSTLSIVIDVYVRYKDFDDPSALSITEGGIDRNITFHRRTVQKL
jgi:cell division protein FtsI/penicillin-binding protein 2